MKKKRVLSILLMITVIVSAAAIAGCGKRESVDTKNKNKANRAIAAQDFIKKANFRMTKNEDGFKTYTATLENTTSDDFEYFTFHINLNDKDGVTVETQNASADNWTAGSKHRFEFETDKKFEKIEVTSCNYKYE